jgi:hypothetical protein
MTIPAAPSPSAVDQRHSHDTQEFTRLVNLSDAVFAIAMTLLVLTVDVPDVPAGDLAAALLSDLPQIGAYALAFALVASQWYAHRKLFQRLAFTEPGLTVINLAWLGMVALVPFPTSVLGAHPTVTAAVAPFLAVFVVVGLGYIAPGTLPAVVRPKASISPASVWPVPVTVTSAGTRTTSSPIDTDAVSSVVPSTSSRSRRSRVSVPTPRR